MRHEPEGLPAVDALAVLLVPPLLAVAFNLASRAALSSAICLFINSRA